MTEFPRAFDIDTELEERAFQLRLLILQTHAAAGHGHLGSALSIVEILTAIAATGGELAPSEGQGSDGDRLVLSKGHAALGLYCALAQNGAIPMADLGTFSQNGSRLEPHPNEIALPAVRVSTGSLGQGLSIGLGMAYGSRLSGRPQERTAVLLGDGELNEGQSWEAVIAAARLGLGNLLAIIDLNGMQQDGAMADIMPIGDVGAAWEALGWSVHHADGHNIGELASLFIRLRDEAPNTPKMVIARTVKGRGVPFLENTMESHYPPSLDAAELELVVWRIRRGGSDDR